MLSKFRPGQRIRVVAPLDDYADPAGGLGIPVGQTGTIIPDREAEVAILDDRPFCWVAWDMPGGIGESNCLVYDSEIELLRQPTTLHQVLA